MSSILCRPQCVNCGWGRGESIECGGRGSRNKLKQVFTTEVWSWYLKPNLRVWNQNIQYDHQAAILNVTSRKVNRILLIYKNKVLLKFRVDIKSQIKVIVWKPKNPIWPPGDLVRKQKKSNMAARRERMHGQCDSSIPASNFVGQGYKYICVKQIRCIFIQISLKFVSWQQVTIGPGNGLAPNRRHNNTWANGDPDPWCLVSSRGYNISYIKDIGEWLHV